MSDEQKTGASWAREFYSGLFVELWLGAMPAEQTREEADFLERVLHVPPGGRILDLACGGGRHTLALAERGYRLTGVDLSPDFLAVARAATETRGLEISWEERALHDLPWNGEFAGAYCMGNSLGGLDDDEIAAFFRAVATALQPGGRFVIDTSFVAESLFPNMDMQHEAPPGDITYEAHHRYDPATGRLTIDYTFTRGEEIETKSGFGQVHTYREFCRIVEHAGFEDLAGYASPAQEPYLLGSPQLLLAASKAT